MRNYGKLRVATLAMEIAEATYRETRYFPRDERFGLVVQMRRAAVSIGSNIAEGCGRETAPQLLHFLQIATGSVSELEYQAQLAIRLEMGNVDALRALIEALESERQMLARFAVGIRARQAGLPDQRAKRAGRPASEPSAKS